MKKSVLSILFSLAIPAVSFAGTSCPQGANCVTVSHPNDPVYTLRIEIASSTQWCVDKGYRYPSDLNFEVIDATSFSTNYTKYNFSQGTWEVFGPVVSDGPVFLPLVTSVTCVI